MSAERGQATVELAALLPLLAVVALAAYAVLAGLSAGEQAGVAAEAGAIAVLQDRDAAAAARAVAVGADPAAAARERLPRRLRRGLRVRTADGGAVSVSVRVPALAGPLELGRVTASAGLGASG